MIDRVAQSFNLSSCARLIQRGRGVRNHTLLLHADAAEPLREWARVMRLKHYREHLEVQKDFPRVDFIGPRKAVFNIGRNKYGLIVDLRYDLGRVYIRHIVTHAEYRRLMKRKGL